MTKNVRLSPRWFSTTMQLTRETNEPMTQILFVECGFGNDQHGQNATKAAVRACRNAIEFNSIPSVRNLVPGGRDNMKLLIQFASPEPHTIDVNQVKAVFPYGKFLPIVVKEGNENVRCDP